MKPARRRKIQTDESDNDDISYNSNHFHTQLWPCYDPGRCPHGSLYFDDLEANRYRFPSFTLTLDEKEEFRRRKVKLETAIIRLLGALTQILHSQEMPTSNLNAPNDLRSVLDDHEANQKRRNLEGLKRR